jgi:hypothetical protein
MCETIFVRCGRCQEKEHAVLKLCDLFDARKWREAGTPVGPYARPALAFSKPLFGFQRTVIVSYDHGRLLLGHGPKTPPPKMNKKSLLPEVSKGGEQSDISSCFVSSASSSLSAAHSLHPRQPPHAAAHHRQRELSADLFAHSRDIEDDSLRVSSSTLFHNSTTVSSALDSPSESNAPAHDDLQSYSPANDRISHREDQRSHHHQYPSAATSHVDHSQSYHLLLATPEGRFDFQQVDGDRASFSRRSAGHRDVRPEPTGPRFDLSHPHSGMEMKTAGDFQDGDHDDDKEHRNRLCQPHDDVGDDAYRRSCASGAGHHDRSLAPEAGASHSEHFLGDGCYRGVCGDGVFAPRQFKQRIADTLLERMRSRADVDAAVVLIGTPAAANATLDEKKGAIPERLAGNSILIHTFKLTLRAFHSLDVDSSVVLFDSLLLVTAPQFRRPWQSLTRQKQG